MEKNIKKTSVYIYIYVWMYTKKNIYILIKEYIYIIESLYCTDVANTIILNQLYFNLIHKQRLSHWECIHQSISFSLKKNLFHASMI